MSDLLRIKHSTSSSRAEYLLTTENYISYIHTVCVDVEIMYSVAPSMGLMEINGNGPVYEKNVGFGTMWTSCMISHTECF